MAKIAVFSFHVLIFSGPEGFRFDDRGMVLPHSILGSLEDFRSYLEAKGETEVNSRRNVMGTHEKKIIFLHTVFKSCQPKSAHIL